MPGELLSAQNIVQFVKKAAEFGGGKIHITVNNAGFTWDGVIVRHFSALLLPVRDYFFVPSRQTYCRSRVPILLAKKSNHSAFYLLVGILTREVGLGPIPEADSEIVDE